MIKIKKIYIILSVLFSLFITIPVFAAELSVISQSSEIGLNNEFEINLLISSKNENINAIEGKIIYPIDLLEIKNIYDGDSVMSFWMEKPSLKSESYISYSGIIPGGYSGKDGKIFSIVFQAKKEGFGDIEISDAKLLIDNGKGTESKTKISNFHFTISEKNKEIIILKNNKDNKPPESFVPQIAHDKNIFNDKWFLVFVAQDKDSGIDYYQIYETSKKILPKYAEWMTAESPQILTDQKLKSFIYIKAVDKFGNERIEIIPPKNPQKWYENYIFWIIISILILIIYALIKKRQNNKI